jgi:hypothetical protein
VVIEFDIFDAFDGVVVLLRQYGLDEQLGFFASLHFAPAGHAAGFVID